MERKIERLQDHYILCGLGRVGRLRMAHAILNSVPADFIEIATHNESLELEMGEIQIGPLLPLANLALKDSGIRQYLGVIIVAVKKHSGTMAFNHPPDFFY